MDSPPAQRGRFLDEACAGDERLQAEVRRLLAELARAGDFLEAPALSEAEEAGVSRPSFREGELLAGRFRVKRMLGAGGMGEVYEAFDGELGHKIAIKTLRTRYARDRTMARRFRAEVLRSRLITHPNVARVYDLFTHSAEDCAEIPFFTMELIEGETLAARLAATGPFSPGQALALLEQMAEALDSAHRAGIIHRDFKPGNVFLWRRADGSVEAKVTDFGIAAEAGSAAEERGGSAEAAGATLVAGTPAYMAPEQLEGEPGTRATDVYALALVAYEMLTGRRAYQSASPLLCFMQKTVDANPRLCRGRPEIPPRWARAIDRAVRLDPRERFAAPREFVGALSDKRRRRQWIFETAAAVAAATVFWLARTWPEKPVMISIAVLPFASQGSAQTYLGDGIAEGLMRELGAFPRLRVAPLDAAAGHRNKNLQVTATALGVGNIVTGSLRQSGHHLHVDVLLAEGSGGKPLWSQSYDCNTEELLRVQREITRKVAARLGLGNPSPGAARPPTSSPEAYDLFLRGRYFGNMRTREGLLKSLDHFERAIGLDRNFALAYTGIAESYVAMVDYGWAPPTETAPKIRTALDRALTLDPANAETEAIRGSFESLIEWNQAEAERAFLRALSRNANLAEAHHWYAGYLWRAGRLEEALREAQEARRLDPVTLPNLLTLGWVRYYSREFPAAIDIGRQALELNPSYAHAHQLMALAYADSRRAGQALAANAAAVRLTADRAVALRYQALVLSRLSGYARQARRAATELETLSQDRQAGYLVLVYAALRDRDRMYYWADRAIQLHDSAIFLANVDPAVDPFRGEPRFQELLKKLGFR